MKRQILSVLVAAATLIAVAGDAAAQQYVDGARPTGMAGAYTAIGTGPTGMYHNPAGIATARMYAVSGTYEYTPAGNVLNASIVDSKTNPKLAAEAGYSYLIAHDDTEKPSGHDMRLALAVPALPNRVSVGLGGRYLILHQNNTELARGFTLDAGFLFQLVETFHAGIVGKNLIDICRQRRCRGVTPLTVGAGVAYGRTTPFNLSADFNVDVNSQPDDVNFEAEVGGEYMAAGKFPIRAGYNYRTLSNSHHVNAGFGWRESRFGVDVGSKFNVRDISDLTVSATIALYFN